MKHTDQPKTFLYIRDSVTGKEWEVETDHNIVDAKQLSQIKPSGSQILLYDPGFSMVASTKTEIAHIDGELGILEYRGRKIQSLCKQSYEQNMFLLMYGHQPTIQETDFFQSRLALANDVPLYVKQLIMIFPSHAHPMTIVTSAVSALCAAYPALNPNIAGDHIYRDPQICDQASIIAISTFSTICALIARHKKGLDVINFKLRPGEILSVAEKFMAYITRSHTNDMTPLNSGMVETLDILCTLHAEHGLNCSTAAMLHLASSGVDVFSSLAAACGALYGPLHGGAAQKSLEMLEKIGGVENVPSFVEKVKKKKNPTYGIWPSSVQD